jgi:hypothetical protein
MCRPFSHREHISKLYTNGQHTHMKEDLIKLAPLFVEASRHMFYNRKQ